MAENISSKSVSKRSSSKELVKNDLVDNQTENLTKKEIKIKEKSNRDSAVSRSRSNSLVGDVLHIPYVVPTYTGKKGKKEFTVVSDGPLRFISVKDLPNNPWSFDKQKFDAIKQAYLKGETYENLQSNTCSTAGSPRSTLSTSRTENLASSETLLTSITSIANDYNENSSLKFQHNSNSNNKVDSDLTSKQLSAEEFAKSLCISSVETFPTETSNSASTKQVFEFDFL